MPYRKLPSKLYSRVVETVWLMARSNSLKACASMTVGLCFHFLGFECARAASITLLAAKVSIPLNLDGISPYNDDHSVLQDVGLGNEAIPLTIAIGSPLSGLVLYLYTKSIKKFGSKFTLRVSFIAVIVFMAIITWVTRDLRGLSGKLAVVSFYAFREIYVSLISSQQWAFVAGTLNKSTSSYIVAFSGVVSAASALGGCLIEQLVNYGGVQALLSTALLASIASFLCTEFAYTWSDVLPVPTQSTTQHSDSAHKKSAAADHHIGAAVEQKNNSNSGGAVSAGADPSINTSKEATGLRRRLNSTNTHTFATEVAANHSKTATTTAAPVPATSHAVDANKHKKGKSGFWADSWNLIWKHKMLQILFVEGVLHQLCGNMLNLMFHNGLRLEITSDATRAMLVGRFFATVNITSCALQCFVLPHILSHSSLPTVLAYIPVFVLAASLFGVVYPSLISVMLSFGTIKVLEYSVMHSASEMIYMPLGHEVRYLGKELIRYFGHKLGKSGSSLVLSAMVSQLQPSLAMQSVWGAILTVAWGGSMLTLANSVRERDQQDEKDLQAQRVAAAAAKFRRTSAEIKTRRKARSFSLDDSAIKLSSNSRAVLRVPGGNKTESAAAQGVASHAAVASGHASEHSATSALPLRSLSASRDSVPPKWKAPLQEGIRSVSLDHSQEAASAAGDLRAAALRNAFERAEKSVVEDVPSYSGAGVIPDNTSGRETVQEPPASPAAVVMNVEGVLQAVLPAPPVPISLPLPAVSPVVAPDPDGLDTITDVSASPEGSLCLSHAERSHAASMDSLNSLTQDFDRTGSFSESIEPHPIYDDGGEDNQPETMYFGNIRPSHASMDSLNSLASGERRLSWERDQRRREQEAQEQQPVMLRVGSVSVSLNSLRATAERQRQGSQDSGSS
jgi:hypothetical protein